MVSTLRSREAREVREFVLLAEDTQLNRDEW